MNLDTVTVVLAATTPEAPSALDNVKTVVDIVGGSLTAIAIVVGGIWAYFKFVKGRTYNPRLEVQPVGEWRRLDGEYLLQLTVSVKNIGASEVNLLQRGTGLRVSRLGKPDSTPGVEWVDGPVLSILEDHAWIEPGETVSDDLLVRLPITRPEPVRIDIRLLWKWAGSGGNIDVRARRILWPPSTIPSHQQGRQRP